MKMPVIKGVIDRRILVNFSIDPDVAKVIVPQPFRPKIIYDKAMTASVFFKKGALGYSPNNKKYEGLWLNTYKWEVKPLAVSRVTSSFFENETIFPTGSIMFDNALLMTNIEHEWSSVANKFCY